MGMYCIMNKKDTLLCLLNFRSCCALIIFGINKILVNMYVYGDILTTVFIDIINSFYSESDDILQNARITLQYHLK